VLAVAARPAKLITPAQLASRLGEPQLRIFDVTQTLGRPPGPFTQALDLACLGEDEQCQDGDAEERGKRCDRSDLGERARE